MKRTALINGVWIDFVAYLLLLQTCCVPVTLYKDAHIHKYEAQSSLSHAKLLI